IATRLQRQLTAQDLWLALRNGKKRYTLGTIAALVIASILFYLWLPEPQLAPVIAQNTHTRTPVNNISSTTPEPRQQAPVVETSTNKDNPTDNGSVDSDLITNTINGEVVNNTDTSDDVLATPQNHSDISLTPATE